MKFHNNTPKSEGTRGQKQFFCILTIAVTVINDRNLPINIPKQGIVSTSAYMQNLNEIR